MRQIFVLCFLGLCVFGGCEKSSVGEVAEKNAVVKKSNVVETRVDSADGDSEMVEKATFGGGCFWGTEAAFRQVKGVAETAGNRHFVQYCMSHPSQKTLGINLIPR